MNVNQLIRVRGAAALLMLLAMLSFGLLSDLRLFRRAVELRPKVIGGDLLSTNERRFDGLRKMLPPHGVVGYISDRQGEAGNDPSFFENYYLTQYSLAPLLVALDEIDEINGLHVAVPGEQTTAYLLMRM